MKKKTKNGLGHYEQMDGQTVILFYDFNKTVSRTAQLGSVYLCGFRLQE
jgi:hypothetical protein